MKGSLTALVVIASCLTGGCQLYLGLLQPDQKDCAQTPADGVPQWLERSCVLAASCTPMVPWDTIGACISGVRTGSSPYGLCLQGANNCADVAKCDGYGALSTKACDGRPKGWSCEGSQAVRCGFGAPHYVDCAFHGGTCQLYSSADKSSAWPCSTPAEIPCLVEEQWHCSGNHRLYCVGGSRYGTDCAARQLTCMDWKGAAYCVRGKTEPPPSVGAASKSKHILQRCSSKQEGMLFTAYANGHKEWHDCDAVNADCDVDRCAPRGCKEILPDEAVTQCEEGCLDDHRMRVCLFRSRFGASQPHEIDCRDHGLKTCIEEPAAARSTLPVSVIGIQAVASPPPAEDTKLVFCR